MFQCPLVGLVEAFRKEYVYIAARAVIRCGVAAGYTLSFYEYGPGVCAAVSLEQLANGCVQDAVLALNAQNGAVER